MLRRFLLVAGVTIFAVPASAQDIVYTPINPSFGGNPFNSAHLLGIANAQNSATDPNARRPTTAADAFLRQIQSRLLSAVASQITEAIFGDNPQDQGTFTFGDQTITFVRGLEGVTLTIINNVTGETTVIEVPNFVTVP